MAGEAEDSLEPDESSADAPATPVEEAAADPEPEGVVRAGRHGSSSPILTRRRSSHPR